MIMGGRVFQNPVTSSSPGILSAGLLFQPAVQLLAILPGIRRELMEGKNELSHEKNPGWLFYIRDYTTQLYRDYNKPL